MLIDLDSRYSTRSGHDQSNIGEVITRKAASGDTRTFQVIRAADLLKIDHRDRVLRGYHRVAAVVTGAEQATFFSIEADKHNASLWLITLQRIRELDHTRGAAGIVICAVEDHILARRRRWPHPDMVIMPRNNHGRCLQRWVRTAENTDHIADLSHGCIIATSSHFSDLEVAVIPGGFETCAAEL